MHSYIYKLYSLFSVSFLILLSIPLCSQVRDTIRPDTIKINEEALPKHSPTKAALFSTFVPGLGQAYNKKYWKIPIIFAGIAIPMYYGLEQNQLFNEKREAYTDRLAGDSTDKYLVPGNFFSNEGLLESMDINRRNRDLMYIIAGIIYALQIVDASVDAHLFYFNVSDDLSLHYEPMLYFDERLREPIKGLTLSLQF